MEPADATPARSRELADQLAHHAAGILEGLSSAHRARERGLAACRQVIRSCGLSIRAVHRGDADEAQRLRDEAEGNLRAAQEALSPHPAVAFSGFLHDAEKEFAEACLTDALVRGLPLPSAQVCAVQPPAWLNGLAEAASELRRHLLDRLRAGDVTDAERLLAAMDDVYDLLVTVDLPDALTGGLRRTTDQLRAVLERTRSDLTLTLVQARLQQALEQQGVPPAGD